MGCEALPESSYTIDIMQSPSPKQAITLPFAVPHAYSPVLHFGMSNRPSSPLDLHQSMHILTVKPGNNPRISIVRGEWVSIYVPPYQLMLMMERGSNSKY